MVSPQYIASGVVFTKFFWGEGGGGEEEEEPREEMSVRTKNVPGVPTGGVGGPTTELLGAATGLESLGKLLCAGLQVRVPAEPTTVTSVEVHDDIGKIEVLDGIGDTVTVAGGRVLASILVRVGDKVGKRIGLDEERESNVGVLLDELDNGCGNV